ncbi:hypothetical protein SRHO_G00071990 [Serrasalmus rhombeus]
MRGKLALCSRSACLAAPPPLERMLLNILLTISTSSADILPERIYADWVCLSAGTEPRLLQASGRGDAQL